MPKPRNLNDHIMPVIDIRKGDITREACDAVVNAANSTLLGGGGVDGAIHRAGGPAILEACMEIRRHQGGCRTGEAVITTGGRLPARFVIHAVGPVWNGGNSMEDALLAGAYYQSLRLAEENGIHSLAFPNISTGIYGFPKHRAATIAIETVTHFTARSIEKVIFVCYDEENFRIYKNRLAGKPGLK